MDNRNTQQDTPVGYFAILRGNKNYRSLWLGEVVSLFGDWFNLIASAALVSHLTQSGVAVGGLFVVRMLAPFLVSPLAGVVADRYNRKTVLILSDISRAMVVVGFLLVRQPQHVWLLYVLTAIQLAISGFFFPARTAILPDIVTPRELGGANALSSATWSVMLALGAAIGGLVAGEWGIYPAFVVDSLSFVLSAIFIANIQYPKSIVLTDSGRSLRSAASQYLEGLSYLKQDLDIFAIALHKGAIALTISGVFQVIQVVLAERIFVIGEGGGTGLGLLYAVAGVGTGIGPIFARHFTADRDRSLRLALGLSYAISILGMMIIAPLASFGFVLFGSFLRAFGGGINWVFSTQLLLQNAPGHIRGRIFSTEFAIFTLASAVSTGIGGWVLDHTALSLSNLLWWTAGLTLIPGAIWVFWVVLHRHEREVEPALSKTSGK